MPSGTTATGMAAAGVACHCCTRGAPRIARHSASVPIKSAAKGTERPRSCPRSEGRPMTLPRWREVWAARRGAVARRRSVARSEAPACRTADGRVGPKRSSISSSRSCRSMVSLGRKLERVARGLNGVPGAKTSEHRSLAEVSARVPRGVVCLMSALRVHDIGAVPVRAVDRDSAAHGDTPPGSARDPGRPRVRRGPRLRRRATQSGKNS